MINEISVTAGWEIINTRLYNMGEKTGAEYVDIKDDRVSHYFDLKSKKSITFKVLLNARYQGKYYLPAVSVEAMYNNKISAIKSGKWVEVYTK